MSIESRVNGWEVPILDEIKTNILSGCNYTDSELNAFNDGVTLGMKRISLLLMPLLAECEDAIMEMNGDMFLETGEYYHGVDPLIKEINEILRG